ncbi:hypothetical protein Tco_1239942, partial [Tanacetum coccineum]
MNLYNALPRKEYESELLQLESRKKVSSCSSIKMESQVTSDSQGGSDEDIDEEEEAKAFNLMARNFRKFFSKGNRFRRDNQFDNAANKFGKGHRNSFRDKGGESSRQKGVCYNCEVEWHFASSWSLEDWEVSSIQFMQR